MREASSNPVYKDERTTRTERFFTLNWEAGSLPGLPLMKTVRYVGKYLSLLPRGVILAHNPWKRKKNLARVDMLDIPGCKVP
jgi:hypothetical protein